MDKATQKALRISRVEVKEADQANIVNRCWVDRTPERARIEVVLLKEEPALNDDAQSYSEVPGWTATKDNGSSVFFQKGRDGWIGIATPSPGSEYYAFINEFTKLLKDAELL
ncbi:hypothetical protein [Corynebacterium ulceribovis]|uniref:hypothetical protein n=1 Tax=Corynebacterium ulceribovis TaxID=487732 RepID=UPI000361C94C|nr:hypothetical protein [Corynebacterium ulceribovis]